MKEMEALSLKDPERISGGMDDTTEGMLELIGKIVDWFENW